MTVVGMFLYGTFSDIYALATWNYNYETIPYDDPITRTVNKGQWCGQFMVEQAARQVVVQVSREAPGGYPIFYIGKGYKPSAQRNIAVLDTSCAPLSLSCEHSFLSGRTPSRSSPSRTPTASATPAPTLASSSSALSPPSRAPSSSESALNVPVKAYLESKRFIRTEEYAYLGLSLEIWESLTISPTDLQRPREQVMSELAASGSS